MARLDAERLGELRHLGRRTRYPAGASLFTEGDDGQRVFLVESGRVKLCVVTEDGREVILAIRGTGELIGELSAIDGGPRSASAVAIEQLEATVIASRRYREWLILHPEVLFAQLVNVIGRLRDSDLRRVELSAYDVDRRVAARLQELVQDHGEHADGGAIRVTVSLSQAELGSFAGASREAVAQSLRRLRRRQIVETSRRGYLILDPTGLAELASGR